MNSEKQMALSSRTLPRRVEAAFIGAAIGDALGWPNERRERGRVGQGAADTSSFRSWTKLSGGRYQPHTEQVEAGEYSDDTQLILALARSLSRSEEWWHYFGYIELPTWTIYERGAGSASKRAAKSFLSGQEPWSGKKDERQKYYEAGGNGAAMRVLPVVAHWLSGSRAEHLANVVAASCVTTHGHPRALVGAAVYAWALKAAFENSGTLSYGSLIRSTLDSVREWSAVPDIRNQWSEWHRATQAEAGGGYWEIWRETTSEVVSLLKVAEEGLGSGALAIDQEILERLGCFDRKISGAGTVAAVASIFLASRYAAAPWQGLVTAAFAHGADTDTIASMTGGLLGAAVGGDWNEGASRSLQDARYISDLARDVLGMPTSKKSSIKQRVTERDLDAFVRGLEASASPEQLQVPDGRGVAEIKSGFVSTKAPALIARSFRLRLSDGQTIHVKKLRKSSQKQPNVSEASKDETKDKAGVLSISTCTDVDDVKKTAAFYRDVVGLKQVRESGRIVAFEYGFALREREEPMELVGMKAGHNSTLFVEVSGPLGLLREKLIAGGATHVDEIRTHAYRRTLACRDPEGNRIEFMEKKTSG